MDSPDQLTDRYWEDPTPDLRLPPTLGEAGAGAHESILCRDSLRGHVVFATSGSSGTGPKLVCLEKRAILLAAQWSNRHLECSSADRWFLALPTFHVGGFGLVARSWLAGGTLVTMQGPWDAAAFVRQVSDAHATVTSLVPTQLYDLIHAGWQAPGSLRVAVIGGARLEPKLRAAAQVLGWPIRESYGMSETAAMMACQRTAADPEGWLPVIPDWEVNCHEGRILVRGKPLLTVYLERAADRSWVPRDPRREDGWFPTGDLGELDSAGRLRVQGREGRIVKILGELVDLERLDLALRALRPEGDAVVEAVEDARAGWKLVLVTERDPTTAERVRDAFNERVAPFERLSGWRTVARLTKSPLGKRLPQPGSAAQADSNA